MRSPTPKQAVFLLLNCKEAGYGGATGGGKSHTLLIDALNTADIPGAHAILFRRTFADLSKPGALMDMAHEWLQHWSNCRWVERDKRWVIDHGKWQQKSDLSFGYMDVEKDKYHYLGTNYHYAGFDEATQFTESMYSYLFSRMRKAKARTDIVIKVRSGTNPGGPGHLWYRRRFIQEGAANGRVFVPSGLRDNPYLDIEDYEEFLAELDPVTRAQYMDGNWDVVEGGGQFEKAWFDGHFRRWDQIPPLLIAARSWDLAATKPNSKNQDPDWTVGALVGLDINGQYWILDVRRIRDSPGKVQEFVAQTAEDDGEDVSVWIEREGGSGGSFVADYYKREVLRDYVARFLKTSGKKEVRAQVVSMAARAGLINLIEAPWNQDFLEELEVFPSEGFHDDQVDAVSMAIGRLRKRRDAIPGLQTTNERLAAALASHGSLVSALREVKETMQDTRGVRKLMIDDNQNDDGIIGAFGGASIARSIANFDDTDNPLTQAAMERGRRHGM